MYALNAHHNIIRNNVFSGAIDSGGSSKTDLFFQEATSNRMLDIVIDDSTQDNIALIKSDNNLVAGNTVTNSTHTLWAIKCGNWGLCKTWKSTTRVPWYLSLVIPANAGIQGTLLTSWIPWQPHIYYLY